MNQFTPPLYFEYFALLLWAISGAIVGWRKGYDVVGVFVIAFVSSFAPCANDSGAGSAVARTSSAAATRAVLQVVGGFARIYRFSGKLPSRQKLTCQRSS